ncbi:SAM-dependent methyltransferase [Rubinisphaera sp. JC750]|uniref:SAM-dependent methyltransferase n=1 Tax=Rubinisphaera sp. JC750 TaxID=2898658 RepID=UPI001F29B217|nr:class I SAM-dependent methyltransferase [Rubinisphaera sp. JC750]
MEALSDRLESPPWPRRLFMKCFGWLRSKLPARFLLARMRKADSPLIQEFLRAPGGWRAMEIIYERKQPRNLVDWYALNGLPLSIEARNRRRLIKAAYENAVAQTPADRPLRILSLGSGPAVEIIEVVSACSQAVTVDAVDLDVEAISHGRDRVERAGLEGQVQFHELDVRDCLTQFSGEQFDLVSIVGLAEYLEDEELTELLNGLTDLIEPQAGQLVIHGYQDTCSSAVTMRRVFNLHMRQRSGRQLSRLLSQSGFDVADLQNTPLGVYPLLTARPTAAEESQAAITPRETVPLQAGKQRDRVTLE